MLHRVFLLSTIGIFIFGIACSADKNDPKQDTETDSETVDGGDGGDGGSDSDSNTQNALTFVLTNQAGSPRYLSGWELSADCEVSTANGWETCAFQPTSCMQSCDEVTEGDQCCVECDAIMPAVIELAPGETFAKNWDGMMHIIVENHCSDCGCVDTMEPNPGRYRVSACYYPSWTCLTEPCEAPDENGVIPNAFPEGEKTCVNVEFEVPNENSEIHLQIEDAAK